MKGTYEIEFELRELKISLAKEMLADYALDNPYSLCSDVVQVFQRMIEKLEGRETEG